MSDKPEALRLADALDARVVPRWVHATGQTPQQKGHTPDAECVAAAAELRRLHDLVTEDSILLRRQRDEIVQLGKALNLGILRINELEAELAEQARLNGMGSEREARLQVLNAELVEALKHAAECVRTNYLPDKCGRDWDDVIAKAEASK